jgi:hypothetical protein
MSSISKNILKSVKPHSLAVNIEKASADPVNGVAKVLFTTNVPARRRDLEMANVSNVEKAFSNILGDKAHLITSSVHKASIDGHYYAFVKLNTKTVALEDASKDDSGYTLVAANVFADANDNIWEVKEDASGNKVLLRNSMEDLSELFSNVAAGANISTAAASIRMTDKLEFASLVTFMDPITEEYHHGVMVDTSNIYDFQSKKVAELNPALAIASTAPIRALSVEMAECMGDNHSTFAELAAGDIQSLFDYLDRLYGHAPAFLSEYKDAIRRVLAA